MGTKRARAATKQWQDYDLDDESWEAEQGRASAGGGGPAAAAAAAGGGGGRRAAKWREEESDEDEPSSTDEEEEERPRKKGAAAAAGGGGSKKKGGKAGAKKAAPKKKERKAAKIGDKKAKKIYQLDDADLLKMKDTKYSSTMFGCHKMYEPTELEAYARDKYEGNEAMLRSLESNLAAERSKKDSKRSSRKVVTDQALQRVELYVAPLEAISTDQYGDTKLPDSVMLNIMECLARTREPGGMRGFACVAKDLANASLANWDCYRAAKAGFAALGEEAKTTTTPPVPLGPPFRERFMYSGDVERMPGGLEGGWEWWSSFLREPLAASSKQLHTAMKVLGVTAKGTKAEMSLEILRVFNLSAATSMPVKLLHVVKLERSPRLAWDGPDSLNVRKRVDLALARLAAADEKIEKYEDKAWKDLVRAKNRGVAYIRAAMRARGYSSIDELVAAAEAADEERKQKEAAKRAAAFAAGLPPPEPRAEPTAPAPIAGLMEYMQWGYGGIGWGVYSEDEDGF